MASDNIIAMGIVSVAGGAIVGADTNVRGCAVARTGVGVYTLTLNQPVNEMNFIDVAILVTPILSLGVATMAQISHTSDSVKTVTILTDAGAAADRSFSFAMMRIGS